MRWGKDATTKASSDIHTENGIDDMIYVDSFHEKLYGTPYLASGRKDKTEELVFLRKIFAEFLRKFIYKSARESIEYVEEAKAVVPEIQTMCSQIFTTPSSCLHIGILSPEIFYSTNREAPTNR